MAHRVVEKVGENAMEFEEIALDHDVAVVNQLERDVRMPGRPRLHGLAGHPDQIDRLSVEVGTSLLELSKVEELIEKLHQSLRFFPDIDNSLARGWIGSHRIELGQNGREAGDPGKWRSHIVSDPDQEVEALGQHFLDF
jgi:hypothetical protein